MPESEPRAGALQVSVYVAASLPSEAPGVVRAHLEYLARQEGLKLTGDVKVSEPFTAFGVPQAPELVSVTCDARKLA